MIEIFIETFLGNISFFILLILLIAYWFQASFSIIPKFEEISFVSLIFINFTLFLLLALRWINYHHFPLTNLYESLIFLCWVLTLFQFILEKISKNIFIGTVLIPITLFSISFANFSLPKTIQQASVLVPALQSNWLMMHVTIMLISYAALISGSLLSFSFLILTNLKEIDFLEKTNLENSAPTDLPDTSLSYFQSSPYFSFSKKAFSSNREIYSLSESKGNLGKFETSLGVISTSFNKQDELPNKSSFRELTELLDNLSYRVLGLGFPLLTIGILSGAVWANEAWGSYWSWDPKETWAFITWLVFAIYLHTRILNGWRGKKPALIATFGFLVIWICYLGVNLLGKGLHSYGWIQ